MAAPAIVHFDDDDVAVGAAGEELTLIGRILGPAPPLAGLQGTLARIWQCNSTLSLALLDWALTQLVFSAESDKARALAGTPWILLPKCLMQVAKWVEPSAEVAKSLLRAPLLCQLWGISYDCLIERLGSKLGASLRPCKPATIHRASGSGGLYIQVKPVLDLSLPLPDEITAGHSSQDRSTFKIRIKYEMLPQLCFLCGIVGHIGQDCPRKEELAHQPPRFGFDLLATESGPKVDERSLVKHNGRYTWLRQPTYSGDRSGRGRPLQGTKMPNRKRLHPGAEQNVFKRPRDKAPPSLPLGAQVNSNFQALTISSSSQSIGTMDEKRPPAGGNRLPVITEMEEGEVGGPSAEAFQGQNVAVRVEETDPNRSQSTG